MPFWDFKANPNFLKHLDGPEIDAALEKAAAGVAQNASELAPIDTGRLRDSYEPIKTGQNHAVISTDFKAVWWEFGTSRPNARNFIVPAVAPLRRGAEEAGLTVVSAQKDLSASAPASSASRSPK